MPDEFTTEAKLDVLRAVERHGFAAVAGVLDDLVIRSVGAEMSRTLRDLVTDAPEPVTDYAKAGVSPEDLGALRVLFDVIALDGPPGIRCVHSAPSYGECVEWIAGQPFGRWFRVEKRFIVDR